MRVLTDRFKGVGRPWRYLALGLVVLVVGLLATGKWQLALGVGVGSLLGWVLMAPTRITWAIFGIAFAVPVTIDFGYPTNPSYTLVLVLFLLAVWGRLHRAERDGWQPRLIAAALLLPACAVIAGLVHWHSAKPVVVGVAPLLCFGVLAWHLVEEARRDRRTVLRVAETFTWISVAIAAFAKYQTLSRSWPIFDQLALDWTYTSAFDATRAVGLSGHPIVYGSFAMAMALVALTIRGTFWYIPFTANLVGLVLSGTRSAWIGTVLALGLWLLFQLRRISWRGVGTGIAIGVATAALVAFNPAVLLPATPAPGPVWVLPPTASAPAATPGSGAPAPTTPAEPGSDAPTPGSDAPTPGSGTSTPGSGAPTGSGAPAGPGSGAPGGSDTGPPASGAPADGPGSRISDPLQSASADARLTRISVVWAGITHDWSTVAFGNGPESNVRYLEDVGIGDGQAQVFDNTYLTFWYNYGLLGLAGLLFLLAMLYLRLRSLPARLILLGMAAQIFFFDVWLWIGAVAVILLAVALGAAETDGARARASARPPQQPGAGRPTPTGVVYARR